MQCREIECIIPSYIKGEEKENSAIIKAHLEECKSCRECADLMVSLSKDLAGLPRIKPEKGYLEKIHSKTLLAKKAVKKAKAPGETTTSMAAVSRSGRMSTSSRLTANKADMTLFEKIDFYFLRKLRTPAFAYSFAVHVVVLGLCFVLYRAEVKISKERRDDAQSLRFAAYNKAIHQNVTLGTIDINVLSKSGEVYITQNARCIQIQLSKPKGDYILATLENGELKLDPKIVSKYFKDSEVTILVFNGAVEVWSKNTLEKYIEEEVAIRPV